MGGNPVGFSDPLGLDVLRQTHPVAFGLDHSKVTIIPQDQQRWNTDGRFSNKTDGNVYMTIGAGPESGLLVSNLNRERDLNLEHNTSSRSVFNNTCPSPKYENEVIERLLISDSNYSDSLDYDYFPAESGDGYNSNSYVSGLLNSVGHTPPAPQSTPGYSKPVPTTNFR